MSMESDLAWHLQHVDLSTQSATRKAALQTWRQHIGRRVFIGRQATQGGEFAAVITRVATSRRHGVTRDLPTATALVQVDILGRRDNAATLTADLGDALRQCISHYNGSWNGTGIGAVTTEREGHVPDPPDDASPYWLHRYSLDFLVEFFESAVTEGPT